MSTIPSPPKPLTKVVVKIATLTIDTKDRTCKNDPGKPKGTDQRAAALWADQVHEAFVDCKTKLNAVVKAVDAYRSSEVPR